MIAILDFGSQYTQLIAKKLRQLGYESQVYSGKTTLKELVFKDKSKSLRGIIISGSPMSVGSPLDPDVNILNASIPVLGICFGYQYLASKLGGEVRPSQHREYGAAKISLTGPGKSDLLTANLQPESTAWMSHGDSVTKLPSEATLLLSSNGRPAAFSIPSRNLWALQFHPEVQHTECGDVIIKNFAANICKSPVDWNLKSILLKTRESLKVQLEGVSEVLCAVSGGVDSTVLAAMLSEVTPVRALFVDHGFLRRYDLADLKKIFAKFPKIKLEVIDASKLFWRELKGVYDPEQKRKIMGRLFIETFSQALGKRKSSDGKVHLAQGTIYSDVIESAANELAPTEKIKSHHNVGGLPENIPFELVEPLRNFFKDEVREMGALLGIPRAFLARHPFPGPGLSIRCIGALEPERIELLAACDEILHDELVKRNLYSEIWQALCVLLPVSTVGVMGDGRSYESVIALRLVTSVDAMTAKASELPWSDLTAIASRIVNEVRGINRVVYDLSSKPPATIEWE